MLGVLEVLRFSRIFPVAIVPKGDLIRSRESLKKLEDLCAVFGQLLHLYVFWGVNKYELNPVLLAQADQLLDALHAFWINGPTHALRVATLKAVEFIGP